MDFILEDIADIYFSFGGIELSGRCLEPFLSVVVNLTYRNAFPLMNALILRAADRPFARNDVKAHRLFSLLPIVGNVHIEVA